MASMQKDIEAFVERWMNAEGNEEREARSFWIELFQDVLGVEQPTKILDFERRVRGRQIDVFYEGQAVLIENKSRGVSLDEPEQRGTLTVRGKKVPRMVTPYEQAKWYADNLPVTVRPYWIVTCNFDEMRIYDLKEPMPEETYASLALCDLPRRVHMLDFIVDRGVSRIEQEKELSVQAGEIVARLYNALATQYHDLDADEREQRSLNVLITRIVFLLYAEDAGVLHRDGAFQRFLRDVATPHMRRALIDLFETLDTPKGERDPYMDPELLAFPYVNGGLFAERDLVVLQFTDEMREILLEEASAGFNWSDISPTIFGAVFESTLNPETRHAGGMHYTSVENIHKLIDPSSSMTSGRSWSPPRARTPSWGASARLRRSSASLRACAFLTQPADRATSLPRRTAAYGRWRTGLSRTCRASRWLWYLVATRPRVST